MGNVLSVLSCHKCHLTVTFRDCLCAFCRWIVWVGRKQAGKDQPVTMCCHHVLRRTVSWTHEQICLIGKHFLKLHQVSYKKLFHIINIWLLLYYIMIFLTKQCQNHFIIKVTGKCISSRLGLNPAGRSSLSLCAQFPFDLSSVAFSSLHSFFCLLPSCFLSGFSLNTNNFFWQSIYEEIDWCKFVFSKIHILKRKQKRTLALKHARAHCVPFHIQLQ